MARVKIAFDAVTRIYSLIDPRDGRVRYVGKTICGLQKRLKQHMDEAFDYGSREFKSEKCKWIRELFDAGYFPEMEEIEVCSYGWAEAEERWINHYKKENPDLTNIQIPKSSVYKSIKEVDDEYKEKFVYAMNHFYFKNDEDTKEVMLKIYRNVYAAKEKGMTLRELKRVVSGISEEKIIEAVDAFDVAGLVFIKTIKTGGANRKAYVHEEYFSV